MGSPFHNSHLLNQKNIIYTHGMPTATANAFFDARKFVIRFSRVLGTGEKLLEQI